MLTDAQRKTIFDGIPNSFIVQGQTISGVAKRYGNQFANDVFPAIVLNYPTQSFPLYVHPDDRIKVSEETIDSFTFLTGTNDYLLTISPADIIREVKGKVSGRVQVIAATNYSLNVPTNEIQWSGPTFPDNNTSFTVEYHHKLVRIFRRDPMYDLFSVNVYAENVAKSPGPGEIHGIVVSQRIAKKVRDFLRWTFANNDMVLTNFSQIVDLDELATGEYTRRRQFDLWVRHHEVDETTVEDIETVQYVIENLVL